MRTMDPSNGDILVRLTSLTTEEGESFGVLESLGGGWLDNDVDVHDIDNLGAGLQKAAEELGQQQGENDASSSVTFFKNHLQTAAGKQEID